MLKYIYISIKINNIYWKSFQNQGTVINFVCDVTYGEEFEMAENTCIGVILEKLLLRPYQAFIPNI